MSMRSDIYFTDVQYYKTMYWKCSCSKSSSQFTE
jgi:hypothetical protein